MAVTTTIDMAEMIECLPQSTLSNGDFAHIKEMEMLESYIKQALTQGKIGVNILLYGQVGIGKMEFAKLLAKNVGATLHKIKPSKVDTMLQCFKYAQTKLQPFKDILCCDFLFDLCNSNKYTNGYDLTLRYLMQKNKIINIFITYPNLSPINATLSRFFDFVVKLEVLDESVRKQMLMKYCGNKIDKKTLNLVATHQKLNVGYIERAAKVAQTLDGDFSNNFLMVLNNSLIAGRYDEIKEKSYEMHIPQSYSIDFINTDINLQVILDGIKRTQNARILIYGLSGTGKSAFARYLAKKCDLECIVKKVSDLVESKIGESEQNIAAAFKEAKDKKAVLVLDEVDSFIYSRFGAYHRWEFSMVNEMLVQIENFDGIFIATTNLIDKLDKAVLRRFDLKCEFLPLNKTQREKLFEKECEILGILDKDNEKFVKAKKIISELERLTPGDFATITRQANFNPIQDVTDFCERLRKEVYVKNATI